MHSVLHVLVMFLMAYLTLRNRIFTYNYKLPDPEEILTLFHEELVLSLNHSRGDVRNLCNFSKYFIEEATSGCGGTSELGTKAIGRELKLLFRAVKGIGSSLKITMLQNPQSGHTHTNNFSHTCTLKG